MAGFALSYATLLFVLRDAFFIGCTLAHEHGVAVDLSTIPQVRSGRDRTPQVVNFVDLRRAACALLFGEPDAGEREDNHQD
jgi:hypothetical protein